MIINQVNQLPEKRTEEVSSKNQTTNITTETMSKESNMWERKRVKLVKAIFLVLHDGNES